MAKTSTGASSSDIDVDDLADPQVSDDLHDRRTAQEQLRVLAHEYQHVLNASQHFRWDLIGRPYDVAWLNEAKR